MRTPQSDQVLVGCVTVGVVLSLLFHTCETLRGGSSPSCCALLCVKAAWETRQVAGLKPQGLSMWEETMPGQ